MLVVSTPKTSTKSYASITKSPPTGLVNATSVFNWDGTMLLTKFTSSCLDMSKRHSPFFSTNKNTNRTNHSTHTHIYGARKQYAKKHSSLPKLDKQGEKFIQKVCGKFLFYGCAVDSTLLVPHQHHCILIRYTYQGHPCSNPATSWLFRCTRQCRSHLQTKWHEACCP